MGGPGVWRELWPAPLPLSLTPAHRCVDSKRYVPSSCVPTEVLHAAGGTGVQTAQAGF